MARTTTTLSIISLTNVTASLSVERNHRHHLTGPDESAPESVDRSDPDAVPSGAPSDDDSSGGLIADW